jgi:hypothetical protein
MRVSVIFPLALIAGCAGLSEVPSLAPRPIEKIGMGAAAPAPPATLPVAQSDAALNLRISVLLGEAREGDASFVREDAANARAIVAGRRAAEGSEAWIAGETARSALEAARQKSADTLAALDQLLVERTTAGGAGITELEAAKAQAEAIVARQTARLDELSR